MQESLLSQGLDLMMFGMGTVCVFLAVLVVVTTSMSKLVVRFFPESEDNINTQLKPASPQPSVAVDDKTLQIIHAAIQQHRQK